MDVEMADAYPEDTGPEIVYSRLNEADSRWRNLQDWDVPPTEVEGSSYDLLLYIRNAGSMRDTKLRSALDDAVESATNQSSNYLLNQKKQVTKVNLRANDDARKLVSELDELVWLARTVYSTPDDLNDWMNAMFTRRYLPELLLDDNGKRGTLNRVMDWADKWAEVRYRFLNHFLRDDPTHWRTMGTYELQAAGNAANAIVHESAVEEDALIAGSSWFTDDDREMYKHVYGIGTTMGARLRAIRDWGDLPSPLQQVFAWSIKYINRIISWREGRLRAKVKLMLSDRDYIAANGNRKQVFQAQRMQENATALKTFAAAYKIFISSLLSLVEDAMVKRKFNAGVWNGFIKAVRDVRSRIRTSLINLSPGQTRQPRWVETWPEDRDDEVRFVLEPTRPNNAYMLMGPR